MLRIDKAVSQKIIGWIFPALIAVFLIAIINSFFLKVVRIRSDDMRLSYNKGDMVLLNKFLCTYNKNDVLAFNFFEDDSSNTKPVSFIQRCIALPGDTVELDYGFVFVNNKEDKFNSRLMNNYHLKAKQKLDSVFLLKYDLIEGGPTSDEFDYSFSLSRNQADSLKKDTVIIEINKSVEKSGLHDQQIFPNDSNYKWNKHNFGKLYIPKKNDTIPIDSLNICFYKKIISVYENNLLQIDGDSIFINGDLKRSYIFKQNYYFVLGDNRDNAVDSRYWGFLPEKYIIGKVISIIYSKK